MRYCLDLNRKCRRSLALGRIVALAVVEQPRRACEEPWERSNFCSLRRWVVPSKPEIHTPYLYCAGPAPGAPFAVHVED